MAEGYTKLFSDIVDSSIWDEPGDVCKVWVTLLALANAEGFIRGSIPWLANKSRVSVNTCQQALTKFESPDPLSRTPDNDGKRIESVDRGWVILNYQIFRDRSGLSEDPRRVYQREWMRKKRQKTELSTLSTLSTNVNPASASASVPSSPKGGVGGAKNPTLEEVKLAAAKTGLSDQEAEKFFNYYTANGWRVGRNPMKSWTHALTNWKINAQTYGNGKNHKNDNPRNRGIAKDPAEQGRETADFLKRKAEERRQASLPV